MMRIGSGPLWRGAVIGLITLAAAGLGSANLAAAQNADPNTGAQGAPGPGPGPARPVMTELGFGIFQQRCLGCHGNPAYERAPSPATLREMAPTTGFMMPLVRAS